LLKRAAPGVKRVAFLSHEGGGGERFGPLTQAAAEKLGVTLHAFGFGPSSAGLDAAFAEMARQRMDGVIVAELPATNLPATQASIHRLAEFHRLPVLHEVLSAADSGGLMAYGHDINKLYRRAPYFIDRILRGTKPGDIPIEQPTDFELRLNLKAARTIGLSLPKSLLVQADRVIE
jgi:putative ABC transport system substrate-binding protein